MASLWIFFGYVQCQNLNDSFANAIIEGEMIALVLVTKSLYTLLKNLSFNRTLLTLSVSTIFYWVVLSLTILGFLIAFDPLGEYVFLNCF